jgi:hypothetical protein
VLTTALLGPSGPESEAAWPMTILSFECASRGTAISPANSIIPTANFKYFAGLFIFALLSLFIHLNRQPPHHNSSEALFSLPKQ